jgi:hypothetical protein
MGLGRHWQYGKYLLRHKWFVFVAGCRLGIPWLALLHDNSKFLPDEWGPYSAFFYEPDGTERTRRDSTGYYKPTDTGNAAFDAAWLCHQRRNKHHWQHWLRVDHWPCRISDHDRYTLPEDDGDIRCLACKQSFPQSSADMRVLPMPDRYRREMLADWRGAGLAQGTPDTLRWYTVNQHKMNLHPETREWIEAQLGYRASIIPDQRIE